MSDKSTDIRGKTSAEKKKQEDMRWRTYLSCAVVPPNSNIGHIIVENTSFDCKLQINEIQLIHKAHSPLNAGD